MFWFSVGLTPTLLRTVIRFLFFCLACVIVDLDVRQFASLVFHHQQRSLFRSVYYTASAVKSIFIILKTDGRTEHNRVSVFQWKGPPIASSYAAIAKVVVASKNLCFLESFDCASESSLFSAAAAAVLVTGRTDTRKALSGRDFRVEIPTRCWRLIRSRKNTPSIGWCGTMTSASCSRRSIRLR